VIDCGWRKVWAWSGVFYFLFAEELDQKAGDDTADKRDGDADGGEEAAHEGIGC